VNRQRYDLIQNLRAAARPGDHYSLLLRAAAEIERLDAVLWKIREHALRAQEEASQ
jgi:hypothetical protein